MEIKLKYTSLVTRGYATPATLNALLSSTVCLVVFWFIFTLPIQSQSFVFIAKVPPPFFE